MAGNIHEKCYDLFLTHAWRYHEDWTAAVALLDEVEGLSWRNFSVPWHDPAMDPNTEVGARFIHEWLEAQVMPVNAVVLLAGVHRLGSARKWVELELEFAKRFDKVVLGLPILGSTIETFPSELRPRVSQVLPWNGLEAIKALDALISERPVENETKI